MKNSTIRLITALAALVVLGVAALVVKLTSHPSSGFPQATYTLSPGASQPPGGLSVVTPSPTSAPKLPALASQCHYDAKATNATDDGTEHNVTLYKLTLANPHGQPVRVNTVHVAIWQDSNRQMVGIDDPYYPTGYPWMPGWRPVTIAPGSSVSQVLTVHLEMNFSGSWGCSMVSYSS